MRLLFLLILAAASFGGWYLWNNSPQVRSAIEDKIGKDLFRTLEIRFTAESLMEANKKFLIKKEGYTFLEPELTYHPYLLMQVKYARDSTSTEEGYLLFSLTDGEMVLDGNSWEKTHGYKDCLQAKASSDDFKLLKVIIANGGSIDREKLSSQFQDPSHIDKWIGSCTTKKLLVAQGDKFRLHFQNPKLATRPTTKLDEALVTFPSKNTKKVKANFSAKEIEKFTIAAFGEDFGVRGMEEVFLPVYSIKVQNPDGSILPTNWNALTGRLMEQ